MLNKIYVRYLMATNMPRMFELIQTRPWCKKMFAQWSQNLHIKEYEKILDVGCGPGVLTQSIAKIGADATGLDQSKSMLSQAQQRKVEDSLKLNFKQGDVFDLPFEDNQFDTIIAASLINIIPTPDKALNEIYRCVKPGGKVSFLVPSPKMSLFAVKEYYKKNKTQRLAASLLELWANNAICLSITDAEKLANDANLKNIVIHYYLDKMVISITGIK